MGVKANEKQTPIALPPERIRELHRAALDLQPYVPRDSREMTKGPMLGYIARWFLTLPPEEQLRVVLAGKQLADAEPLHEFKPDPALRQVADQSRREPNAGRKAR